MTLQKYRMQPKNQKIGMKIPTDDERAKIARRRGGFDDSYIDKKAWKRLGNTHFCYYCKERLKPKMYNHRKGFIRMGCDTDDCIGNVDTSEVRRIKKLKELGARRVDAKLVTSFKQLLYGRDPARMWAVKDRVW